MRTDDLISMLSTNVEPVDHRHIVRNIGTAVVVGAALAVAIVFFVLGPRADLTTVGTFGPGAFEGGCYSHHSHPGVHLPDQIGSPGRGTKNAARLCRIAVYCRHVACRGEPRIRVGLSLEWEDFRR